MRGPVDEAKVRAFIRALGLAARAETKLYFTGGATAVLLGWRASTVDLDIRIVPDASALLRELPAMKEDLRVNVELASPADFIPELPGWRERSRFIAREGKISFYHYDFYSQVLSKILRGHDRDRRDAKRMLSEGLVDPKKAMELFHAIEGELFRFPAIDLASFRHRVEQMLEGG